MKIFMEAETLSKGRMSRKGSYSDRLKKKKGTLNWKWEKKEEKAVRMSRSWGSDPVVIPQSPDLVREAIKVWGGEKASRVRKFPGGRKRGQDSIRRKEAGIKKRRSPRVGDVA